MHHPTPHTIAALIWAGMLAVKAVGMARRWQRHRAQALSRAFGRELRRRELVAAADRSQNSHG
ncbi:hypothetical protein [Synechococcus sp. MW101C3]|uniref:hypothetical protein n=1 Tax=Synechococcus sp. MW101C3 TaxID=210768 RepID=UPI000B995824|nr:hypothetical protein [Synechococcus sp. MW101C3]